MSNKPKIANWSFSSLMDYEKCPYMSKLKRLDKVPDLQPKTAADRGTQLHQECEDYVRGKAPITHGLRHFVDDLSALGRHFSDGRVICEEEWAFCRDWAVTDWKSGWLRLKADAVCFLDPTHAAVVDYKSGKRFGNEVKHAEQLQLYAVCSLLRYPAVEQVTTELWYLDQNELASFVMTRKQMPKYLKLFDRRGREMTEDTVFKPNPNIFSCKYCPYGPDRQGDCQYGVSQDAAKSKPVFQTITAPKSMKKTRFDTMLAAEAKKFK